MMPNMMNPDSPVVLSLLHKLQDEYSRSSLEPDIKFLQSMAAMIVGDAYKGCMDHDVFEVIQPRVISYLALLHHKREDVFQLVLQQLILKLGQENDSDRIS